MNDQSLFGKDLFGESAAPKSRGKVASRFVEPPFSTLDARGGSWQERKRAWLALGIKSEIGRAANLGGGEVTTEGEADGSQRVRAGAYGAKAVTGEDGKLHYEVAQGVTSIFDPVLCELAYRWFCPPGGQILDPFSGGSVRGIVAAHLGYRYTGFDLRGEQIAANQHNATEIERSPEWADPTWHCMDSRKLDEVQGLAADMVFSCPPYGDLEVYSDKAEDLSNMSWPDFVTGYRKVIAATVAHMKPNTFAAWVIGDYRDKKSGVLRGFVPETVRAFEDAGARYYNEGVVITAVGTAALRATKQFNAGRKLVKAHQNLLVFVKGDWKAAASAIPVAQ